VTGSRRADALVAAAETLDGLQIDQSYVIDPFAAIDQLGLTLSIVKLDNLLGAVVPRGTGGVLITSERSPAIQRYTAAHELGHWILHHDQLQVDGETEVLGPPSNEIEREAQLFAGYFLMPPALFNQATSAYGLKAGRIAPEQVYRLSRDLDVSYEAAARRLYAARLIDGAWLAEILAFGRMQAMQRASAGHRPADGLADMWDATSDDDVVNLVVEEHDEILMQLPEQRLAGWRWLSADEMAQRNSGSTQARPRPRPVAQESAPLSDPGDLSRDVVTSEARAAVAPDTALEKLRDSLGVPPDGPPAALVEDIFVADGQQETAAQRGRRRAARVTASSKPDISGALDVNGPLVGGNGVRTLIVRTSTAGDWNLQLYYTHAYDPREEPLLTYELRLSIQPTPNTAFRTRRLESDLDLRLPGDPDDDAEFA
jgi:Zn-dependent peptidase ImmA (M78 family)